MLILRNNGLDDLKALHLNTKVLPYCLTHPDTPSDTSLKLPLTLPLIYNISSNPPSATTTTNPPIQTSIHTSVLYSQVLPCLVDIDLAYNQFTGRSICQHSLSMHPVSTLYPCTRSMYFINALYLFTCRYTM